MTITCIWEHNGDDTLLYAGNVVGAFTRGASLEEAMGKMPREVTAYGAWAGKAFSPPFDVVIAQEKQSTLCIRDADSDVLFDSERGPLSRDAYEALKQLALKSAADFMALYEAFSEKNQSALPPRSTFYGPVPRTAEDMYRHTKNVNAYYWGEIGVDADNEGTILECRRKGFALVERSDDYLSNRVFDGSYGEQWTLAKVLRRFIWHDRIHAKAMYRMGKLTFGDGQIPDVFRFGER